MPNNTAIIVYVVFSLLVIGTLAGFLIHCNNNQCSQYADFSYTCTKPRSSVGKPIQLENDFNPNYNAGTKGECKPKDMCLCSGGGNKLCANRDQLLASYNQGNTEYQNFSATQKDMGGPFWHSTDFNKY